MSDVEGERSFEPSTELSDLWPTLPDDGPPSEPENVQLFDCTGEGPQRAAGTEAARLAIENGQCIVLPTDTVYGIGADAFSPEAVQRLLKAKQRGRDMPPPVLIADATLMRVLAIDVPQPAKDVTSRHWPGPLTVILRAQPSLRLDLGDTEGTIALRVPDHELARDVLRQTGPMAVSSANLSGRPAALSCEDAIEELGGQVSVYLDGGRLSEDAAPSTIVDFTQTPNGEVLRHGALSVETLREVLPGLDDLVVTDDAGAEVDTAAAGMLDGDGAHGALEDGAHADRAHEDEAYEDKAHEDGASDVDGGADPARSAHGSHVLGEAPQVGEDHDAGAASDHKAHLTNAPQPPPAAPTPHEPHQPERLSDPQQQSEHAGPNQHDGPDQKESA